MRRYSARRSSTWARVVVEIEAIEVFDGERRRDRAVGHGHGQILDAKLTQPCKIAHHSTRETVAGTRGILDLFRWVARQCHDRVTGDQRGTMLTLLDDDEFGTVPENTPAGGDDVRFAGKLPRLRHR